ncbi:MAG: NAD-dependent epimerase/dehydratase family protein [Chloroflexota bacterium]|jgi:UDP-glucose 4-epimerase
MKVLVTGGTGFIGSHLVDALLERGHYVITLSTRPDGPNGVEHHQLDVASDEATELASKVEAIVHLAGLSNASVSFADPFQFNRVNALGTLAILEGARRSGARVVFASSQRIYRPSLQPIPEFGLIEPQDPYGYSKLCGESWLEMYARFYDLQTVALRFFSVYGPGLKVVGGTSGVAGIFVGRALRGEPITVHANQKRDLTYVSDVVQGILLTLDNAVSPGSCYNVATGVGTSMEGLAELVCELTHSRSKITVESSESFGYLVADISKAQEELDYSPRVDLAEGLERYIAWYRANS